MAFVTIIRIFRYAHLSFRSNTRAVSRSLGALSSKSAMFIDGVESFLRAVELPSVSYRHLVVVERKDEAVFAPFIVSAVASSLPAASYRAHYFSRIRAVTVSVCAQAVGAERTKTPRISFRY